MSVKELSSEPTEPQGKGWLRSEAAIAHDVSRSLRFGMRGEEYPSRPIHVSAA